MSGTTTRRAFLKQCAAAGAGLAVLPSCVRGVRPNERLTVGAIGVGGRGSGSLHDLAQDPVVQVVGLCDVDRQVLQRVAPSYPDAATFVRFEEMLETLGDRLDAVLISTPDHGHGPAALAAIDAGKHVYCEKPLCHTLGETRAVTEAARRRGVATQMGIQIHAHIAYRMAVQLIRDGAIGKVREVHVWTNKPNAGPRDIGRPRGADPVPEHFDWQAWLGVAPFRPYKADAYHPYIWRGFLDFGVGMLGDMGAHLFDSPFKALGLGAPISVWEEGRGYNNETYTKSQRAHYVFPGTDLTEKTTLPLTWHDGDFCVDPALIPLEEGAGIPEQGSLMVGEEGVMLLPHWSAPRLLPRERFTGFRYPEMEPVSHHGEWVQACLGNGRADANFDYSGPLTEAVLLGVLAGRFPGRTILWNSDALEVTNLDEANRYVSKPYLAERAAG